MIVRKEAGRNSNSSSHTGSSGGRGSSALALPSGGPSFSSLAPITAVAGTSAYDDAVREFVEILEVHMKNSEKLNRYAEADIARQRWMELKEHELFRSKETMRSKQLAELLGLEESYVTEFRMFHMSWHQKEAAFEQKSADTVAEMRYRHDVAKREFLQKMLIRSSYPRHSSDYFNMRKIEEYLAKGKKLVQEDLSTIERQLTRATYVEAAAMREKADALEVQEEEKWNIDYQASQIAKEAAFNKKQDLEMEGCMNRTVLARAQLARDRQKALEMLLLRYSGARNEIERVQRMEAQKYDKEVAMELKAIRASSNKLAY